MTFIHKKVLSIPIKNSKFFIFTFSLLVSEAIYGQNQKIILPEGTFSIRKIFQEIEKQTGLSVDYNQSKLNINRQTAIKGENNSLSKILDEILSEIGLTYKIDTGHILILPATEKKENSKAGKQIKGTVTDKNGEPIIGANIAVKGTTTGTITDIDGQFALNIPADATILISYIGYNPQEISMKNKISAYIQLSENTQALEEIVIVGYGIQKKVNLTGSVATVKAEDIQDIPASNLSNALSGRLAGVNITQSAGKPGGGSSVSIRAEGTWNSTDPLYVIDGVVRDKFAFDGLDASEVENLSVLKDAASAAIYGARAANGVILVTTKKGKIGKPTITYTGSAGISHATKIPKVMNAYEQALFSNNVNRDYGVSETDNSFYTPDELEYFKNNEYDWLDEAWKIPLITRHSIHVNGGNDKVRYFVGGNYYYESGSFDNLNFKKYSLRSNVEANITKNLIATLNINLDMRNDKKPFWKWDDDNDTMGNLYHGLLTRGLHAPYINGKPNGTFIKWHPLEVINGATGYNRKKYSNYEINMALQYNVSFVKGLSFKLMYNKYDRHTFIKQFNRPYPLYVFKTTGQHGHVTTDELQEITTRDDGDYLYQKYTKDDNYQLNAMVTYNNSFGKHDVNALFVYEQSEGSLDWMDGQRNYFISSAIDQLFAGSSDPKNSTLNGSGSETGRISYVGRVSYGYDNRYLLEASFRYDGSVNFAPRNRWGFFPSASAAWRISEEKNFRENIHFIDYLKIRGSIGVLGNDAIVLKDKNAISGWQWMQRYKLVSGAQFGTLSNGLQAEVIPNVDITWEKSLTYNGGFDAKFLKNKLSFNLDAFYRHTYDILGDRIASLPSTFGAKMPSENYAVIDSKGFEIEVGYNNKIGEDFKFYLNGNIGYAKNKLIIKDEAENLRSYKSEIGFNTDREMGYIATDIIRTQADLDALPEGYTILGLKPELGMLNYKDLRGANSDEPDGKIDDNDKDWVIGHKKAPVNYGFSLGGSWKGLSIDLFFQGVAGIERFYDWRSEWAGMEESTFAFRADYWTPDNINANIPEPEIMRRQKPLHSGLRMPRFSG